MDFASLKSQVQSSLDDRVFFSDGDIELAINEGYLELADDCEFFEVNERVDTQGLDNDLEEILTYPIVSLLAARNPRTQSTLIMATPKILDEIYVDWEKIIGEPAYSVLRSYDLLQLYPHQNVPENPGAGRIGLEEWKLSTPNVYTATDRARINICEFAVGSRFADGALDVWYTAIPPEMVEDTDEPQMPLQYQHALVEYALYSLYADDGETERSLDHWANYLRIRERLFEYMQSRQVHDRVGVVGASL